MQHTPTFTRRFTLPTLSFGRLPFSSQFVAGLLLVISLLAFELFNFDTTQYALADLLGSVSFAGLRWATILAIAFCAIDFAGLVRFFMPAPAGEQPREIWYLMGAWLLGATMNAMMTWWAVSLTLINHELGNEVLSRGQLLEFVPIFVAVLVWLTRILFIGALTVAGDHLFQTAAPRRQQPQPTRQARQAASRPAAPVRPRHTPSAGRPVPAAISAAPASRPERPLREQANQPAQGTELPLFLNKSVYNSGQPDRQPAPSRTRQRPPVPVARRTPAPMQARGRGRN